MRRPSTKLGRSSGLLASRRLDNLSTTVNDLFQKAMENEQSLRRFQRFELRLLDVADLESLLDMLLVNSLNYFHLKAVELWLYDPQQTLGELLADSVSIPGLRLLSSAEALNALYGRHPEVKLASLLDLKDLPVFEGESLRSAALLPLVRHGVLVGSLHFGAEGHQRFTLDKSTDFIAHLASVVAVCLENAVNQERLVRLSMYDMLTQVKNRRAFQQALDKEISRATRSGDPLSLLFIDLDLFKAINDTHGHPTGDRVLKAVAQHIQGMLRKTDHVCRYGGEEFALVLPHCSQQRAMEIAERIRLQVSELRIANDEGGDVSLTLSIGVSCWLPMNEIDQPRENECKLADTLILCADKGVYRSKASGRNAIHFEPLALSGAS